MSRTLVVASLAAAALSACATAKPAPKPFELTAAPAGTLTAGLIVSSGTTTAQEQSDAFALFLQKALAKPARAVVFPDYDTLADALAAGKVDVAFLAPMAYVRTTAQAKITPVAKVLRNGQATYRSVLFGPAASAINNLDELKKANELKVAWVDPSSATGYIFAKALLMQKGINPAGVFKDQAFLASHDAVCRAVAEGQAQVGASYSIATGAEPVKEITGCQNALPGAGAAALKVIAVTDAIPNDVLAVKDGFPEEARAALDAAARALSQSDEGKKTLAAAFHAEGFTDVRDEDYAPVRAALLVFKQ
ncbi:MAG TPA: phosphate/phosphite/phosphonate ABC transporter substrate-binding protein [Myxococcales bacterium]|jgi:phosphonate transport system substrate-binding protein